MQIAKVTILAALFTSATVHANADTVNLVQASKEVRLLSECASELATISTRESWVGSIEKVGVEDGQSSYSYTYNIYRIYGLGNTVKLGSVTVGKVYIPNPPADSSSFATYCSAETSELTIPPY